MAVTLSLEVSAISLLHTNHFQSSSVGTFTLSLMQLFLNDGLKDVVLPYVNQYLEKSAVPFPTIPNVKFTNVTMAYSVGYIQVGLDIAYSI